MMINEEEDKQQLTDTDQRCGPLKIWEVESLVLTGFLFFTDTGQLLGMT